MAKKQTTPKSTQNSLLISEIKDGITIMRDGSLRAVILASAINFDLMSQQEQDAVEFSFQGFLNSLHFPVQIVIRSEKIDLDNYLDKLTNLRNQQDNELLGQLMDDYIQNVRSLVDEVNIMDKRFYVVVPFFPPVVSAKVGLVENVKGIIKPKEVASVTSIDFEAHKTELTQRVQLVAGALGQLGVRAIPLNTQEVVELFYASYNPDVATNQKLIETADLQTATVTRKGPPPQPAPPAPIQTPVPPQAITPAPTPTPPPPIAAPAAPPPAPAQAVPQPETPTPTPPNTEIK